MVQPQHPSSAYDPHATIMSEQQGGVTASLPAAIGGWVIERRLGAGAMGEVFLAVSGQQRAALKLVAKRYAGDDAFTQRFQREIALLSSLDNPGVAKALDWGDLDGRPWLAMEYVDGPTVESMLESHGPFFEADVLRLAVQVAGGLDHIHQRAGLIHRDIKPANILIARAPGGDPARLLNPGDTAKLIDFGLAKPVEAQEDHGLTMTGMIMGTPNYIAPEQVACERTLTLHVDMYALGATMFHLLTGRVPFQAGSAAAVMAAHLNQPVPDPGTVVPALSPATRRLIQTTLAKTASARFSDWNAFAAACEKALAALGEGRPATGAFLRKPMPRPASAPALKPAPSRPGSEPHAVVASSGALVARPGTAAAVAAAVSAAKVGPGDGSAALRAAVTSKITKVQTSSVHRRSDAKVERPGVKTSAVHKWSGRLEAKGTTGGAILPWLTLGAAAVAAIAGAAWAMMQR